MFQVVDPRLEFIGNKVQSQSFASYVSLDLVSTFRLDCSFYSPTFVDNELLQLTAPHERKFLGDLAVKFPNGEVALSDGTHDTIEKLGGYLESGYRLITSGEVANGFDSKGVFISENAHRRNRRSEVLAGDLLIAVRGSTSVGVARLYPENMPTANINTAAARVRLNNDVDPYWVVAFLNSYVGRINSLRLANGVNQLNMNMEELAAVPVTVPDRQLQQCIGNKIRLAERLKSYILEYRCQIDALLNGLLPASNDLDLISENTAWIYPRVLGMRLDGSYNHPNAVRVRQRIARSSSCRLLSSVTKSIVCGPFGSTLIASEQNTDGDVVLVQPTDISNQSFARTPGWRITSETLTEKGLRLFPPRTLLFARVGIYPHCGVLPERIPKATISSSMIAAIVDEATVDPYYLNAFYSSPIGQSILHSLQKGTAQPTISTSELADTEFPCPDIETQKTIGAMFRDIDDFEVQIVDLLKSAMTDVESLLSKSLDAEKLLRDGREVEERLNTIPQLASEKRNSK